MKLICRYCNTEYEETLTNCPNCGAPNENVKKTAESGPRTLEELKDWFYNKQGLTSKKTHIYVGEDCKEAAVFGMYKDENTGDFVVYKNKANGERAIRYQGVDEQYAVNELYQLIQRQALRNGVDLNGALNPGKITNRNSAINNSKTIYRSSTGSTKSLGCFGVLLPIICILFFISIQFYGNWKVSNELETAYKNYQSNSISENDYYRIVNKHNRIEYKDGQFIKNGSSITKTWIISNYDADLNNRIICDKNNNRFNTREEIVKWMEQFPQNETTTYTSSDDYWYKSTDFYAKRLTNKSFYIDAITSEHHHYVDRSKSDSGGSSWDDDDDDWGSNWDDDDDWDSGDWSSSWGYHIIPEFKKYYI